MYPIRNVDSKCIHIVSNVLLVKEFLIFIILLNPCLTRIVLTVAFQLDCWVTAPSIQPLSPLHPSTHHPSDTCLRQTTNLGVFEEPTL